MSTLAKSVLCSEAIEYVKRYLDGIMRSKVMLVGFFSRGPVGAKAAIPAI